MPRNDGARGSRAGEGYAWKKREDVTAEKVLELKASGLGATAIARALKCSTDIVYRRLQEKPNA